MKIRTDFVTNSSSSSFTVDIIINLKDGSKLTMGDNYEALNMLSSEDDEYDVSECEFYEKYIGIIDDVLLCSDISELCELLKESFVLGTWDGEEYSERKANQEDSYDEDYDDDFDDEDEDADPLDSARKEQFLEYLQTIESDVASISSIKSVEILQKHESWGEGASDEEPNGTKHMIADFSGRKTTSCFTET